MIGTIIIIHIIAAVAFLDTITGFVIAPPATPFTGFGIEIITLGTEQLGVIAVNLALTGISAGILVDKIRFITRLLRFVVLILTVVVFTLPAARLSAADTGDFLGTAAIIHGLLKTLIRLTVIVAGPGTFIRIKSLDASMIGTFTRSFISALGIIAGTVMRTGIDAIDTYDISVKSDYPIGVIILISGINTVDRNIGTRGPGGGTGRIGGSTVLITGIETLFVGTP